MSRWRRRWEATFRKIILDIPPSEDKLRNVNILTTSWHGYDVSEQDRFSQEFKLTFDLRSADFSKDSIAVWSTATKALSSNYRNPGLYRLC
jgi:hypothetical protein